MFNILETSYLLGELWSFNYFYVHIVKGQILAVHLISLYCFLFSFEMVFGSKKKMRRPDIPHIFGFYLISCGSVKKISKKNQSDLFSIQILNSRSGYQQWRKKCGFISTQDFSFLLFYSKILWITNQIHFYGTVKQKKLISLLHI